MCDQVRSSVCSIWFRNYITLVCYARRQLLHYVNFFFVTLNLPHSRQVERICTQESGLDGSIIEAVSASLSLHAETVHRLYREITDGNEKSERLRGYRGR